MATDDSLRTAPLGPAFFQSQYTSGFTLLAAGAVIVAAPVVIVYLFLQRHLIRGMLEGTVRERCRRQPGGLTAVALKNV